MTILDFGLAILDCLTHLPTHSLTYPYNAPTYSP